MESKTQNFLIDSKKLNKLINTISKNDEYNEIDINVKQFLVDVIMGNYKISKKNSSILVGSVIMLVTPTEMLSSIIFGRIAFVIDSMLGFFDEAFFTIKIINIILEEVNNYKDHISSESYVQSELKVPLEINFDTGELINNIKSKSNGFRRMTKSVKDEQQNELVLFDEALCLSDVISYTTVDYKDAAIKYILSNQKENKNNFVKLDAKKIKKLSFVSDVFDEVEFNKVVQSKMKDVLESSEKKLGTYRLKTTTCNIYDNYETNIKGTTKLYNLVTSQLSIGLLCFIENEVNNIEDNICNIVFVLEQMLIEATISDKYEIQVITSNVKLVRVSEDITMELTNKLNNSRLKLSRKIKTEAINDTTTDQIVRKQIELALYKIYLLKPEQSTVEFTITDFLKFVPLYKDVDKMKYLLCIQNNFDNIAMNDKNIAVDIEQDYSIKLNKDAFSPVRDRNYLMLNTVVKGNYDKIHMLDLIQRLFSIQLYATDTDLLNIVVNADCLNGMVVQAKQYGNHDVSVIDGLAALTNSKEYYIESLIRKEVKSNMKLIKKYS